jgi:hypothetical protein
VWIIPAVCLVGAGVIVWVRHDRVSAEESAFRKLCRARGLRHAERRTLREMAARSAVEHPVALLLSPDALRRATSPESRDERQLLAKLSA